jgi:hypothetical protein
MCNPEWDNHNPNHGKLTEKQLAKFKEDILNQYGDDMLPIDEIMFFLKEYRFED